MFVEIRAVKATKSAQKMFSVRVTKPLLRVSRDTVDQEIDDDAGNGDVEPERESVSCDEAVLVEAGEEGSAEGDEDERDDHDCEDGVRDEDSEIDGTDPALAVEVDHLVDADVVDEVGDEEGTGDEEGSDHEDFVEAAFARADGGVADGKENGTGAVEGGVEGRVGHEEFSVLSKA